MSYLVELANRLAVLENDLDIPPHAQAIIGEAVALLDSKFTATKGYPFDDKPVKLKRVRK